MLQFYKIMLPDVKCVEEDKVTVDATSVATLRDHSPWLLDHFIPAAVQGDGKCLFRAVSLALYGDESYHVLLHLLTAVESLLYPSLYDRTATEYYQPFKVDACLLLSDYNSFVCDVVRNGAYADMHTVFGTQLCDTNTNTDTLAHVPQDRWASPMTKLVVGRGVQTEYALNVLWTIGASEYRGAGTPLNTNHFVPMISVSSATSAQVEEEEDSAQQGSSDITLDGSRDAQKLSIYNRFKNGSSNEID